MTWQKVPALSIFFTLVGFWRLVSIRLTTFSVRNKIGYRPAEELDIELERSCRFYEILAPYFRKVSCPCMHAHSLQQLSFCFASASCHPKIHAMWCILMLRSCLQKWDAAEGLLYICRKLLSQPYVAPVYAMLLFQWLLANKDAGGAEQRQKHVNLLVAGAWRTHH